MISQQELKDILLYNVDTGIFEGYKRRVLCKMCDDIAHEKLNSAFSESDIEFNSQMKQKINEVYNGKK